MGFLLAQGGTSLYKIDPSTGVATTLTLPSGVTLSASRKPKFAVLDQFVAMVNSPTQNLAIDPEGTVRVLVPRAPTFAPVVASGGSGAVTGSIQARVSFVVLGADGSLLFESPLSPASVAVALSANSIAISSAPIALDAISARRVYRNINGGTVFYRMLDIDGNIGTTGASTVSDAALTLLPVDSGILVAPPGTLQISRMRNIVSWKSRLWGVGSDPSMVDSVVYSESRKVYAWPNSLTAYPTGQDTQGIVAFAPRRDQLGVLKRDGLWQIAGAASGSSGISNPSLVQVVFGKAGCIAPDTVVSANDYSYWLGDDGVWEWGPGGVKNITDETVKPWFESKSADNLYFNPAQFANAFARFNVKTNSYELHLATVGSSNIDRWVSFNLTNRKWYGPHKTDAFTPSHAYLAKDTNNLPMSLVGGSDGVIYVGNQSTFRDGSNTAIAMDCTGPFHNGNAPDIEHFFGQLSMLTKIESGGTLVIVPKVGRLDAAAQASMVHNLTTGREQLAILGDGAMCQLRFQQSDVNQGATIYGYEIDPVFENGRR